MEVLFDFVMKFLTILLCITAVPHFYFVIKRYNYQKKELILHKEIVENYQNYTDFCTQKFQEGYGEYINLFKTYYNEDWNRDTPFLSEIEALQIFFSQRYNTIYPTSILCKDIIISEEDLNQLKMVFKEDLNTILEMSLEKVILFSADLKSYREGSSENGNLTPEEFYQRRLNY